MAKSTEQPVNWKQGILVHTTSQLETSAQCTAQPVNWKRALRHTAQPVNWKQGLSMCTA